MAHIATDITPPAFAGKNAQILALSPSTTALAQTKDAENAPELGRRLKHKQNGDLLRQAERERDHLRADLHKWQTDYRQQQIQFDDCKADYAVLLECHALLKRSWEELRGSKNTIRPEGPASDDGPVVVAERPVKRKDGRYMGPVKKVKVEAESSSLRTQHGGPDSIDLDELEGTMITPRKSFRAERDSPSCTLQRDVPPRRHEDTIGALRPLDVNIVANAKSAPQLRMRSLQAIPCLAEDGDDSTPSRAKPGNARRALVNKKTLIKDRGCLQKLLQDPTQTSSTVDVPENEPLRARPCNRLKLNDFRLNPTHSHYAYHETIRKHDEKEARGGCTDASCQRCSELARFMALSGFVERNDDDIICSYLGVDSSKDLSADEKTRLLPIARQAYANDKFGKHRQGQRTAIEEPPGFWDTDFPSTQRNQQLRREADRLERAKIQQRWNEAMRTGGKWIFADEQDHH